MAWHRNPARLWLIIGVLAVALGGGFLAALDQEQTPNDTQVNSARVRTVGVTSQACRRAVEVGGKVALAAGSALYVAPDFPGLVRDALDAPTGDKRKNLLARLRAATSGLRKARALSESGDPPAWWRFEKWSARCLGETSASVRYQPPGGNKDDVRSMIRRFMDARLRGRGAAHFVAQQARDEFGRNGSLGPMYVSTLEDFEIAFVDGDGPNYEVGIELIFRRGSYGDTLFVVFDGVRYKITGGRTGLEGP